MIQELKHIRSVIRKIEPQLRENVMRDFLKRIDICKKKVDAVIYQKLCFILNFRIHWIGIKILFFQKKQFF